MRYSEQTTAPVPSSCAFLFQKLSQIAIQKIGRCWAHRNNELTTRDDDESFVWRGVAIG
jgi:hypothetical protein